MENKLKEKIQDIHDIVVRGLVNGLSVTSRDERLNDIEFWRKRCELFNLANLGVMALVWGREDEYALDRLKELAEEGYKNE